MLYEFITEKREQLINLARAKVAKRLTFAQRKVQLEGGAPLFLDQLVQKLKHPLLSGAIGREAAVHGAALLELGYTVSQVVHDYGDICQAITELASDVDLPISTDEFHILNLCVDDAIAEAVAEYSRCHELTMANGDSQSADAHARTRLTYRIMPTGGEYVAKCEELPVETTGKSPRAAIEALRTAVEQRLASVEAMGPPSRPPPSVRVELTAAAEPERDPQGPGDPPLPKSGTA
ncbi:MAG: hypothetical protein ACLQVI_32845 [Polyangiaceae bacterium]|jgi:hypothetical protein